MLDSNTALLNQHELQQVNAPEFDLGAALNAVIDAGLWTWEDIAIDIYEDDEFAMICRGIYTHTRHPSSKDLPSPWLAKFAELVEERVKNYVERAQS